MAKKSKEFQELLREKKYAQDVQENLQALKHKIQRRSDKSGSEIELIENDDVEKMSDILKDFVSPFMRNLKKFSQVEKLFKIAIAVWNLTFFPKDEQELTINLMIGVFSQGSEDIQEDLRYIIYELIERKNKHFSHVQRIITDFRLSQKGGEYHITVAYSIINLDDNDQS